jgi:uncharacterized damage-inducible protein DinB
MRFKIRQILTSMRITVLVEVLPMSTSETVFLTTAQFLEHYQGHRGLTRRVIEAFPEDQLFTFAAGPMRPFGVIAWELHVVADDTLRGLQTDNWEMPQRPHPETKQALLEQWDALDQSLESRFSSIAPEQLDKVHQLPWFPMVGHATLSYMIDNEIHHRGQGYVYLRLLGIEPPAFYER